MTNSQSSKNTLLSAGIIMASGMLLGRAAGFIREIILAKYFGVSSEADIAVLMLTFPDLLIALFIGGATNIVFIPLFQETKKEDRFSSFVFFSLLIFLCFSVLSFVLSFFTPQLIGALAPGLNQSSQDTADGFLKFVLIAVPLTALASVSRAYLQASHRFATTSLENLFYNLAVILGIVLFTASLGLQAILFAIFAGVFMRWSSQLCNILSYSSPKLSFKNTSIQKGLLKSYFQALGAGIILVFLPLIARSIASLFVGDGAIAIFNYSYKLIELPFGVAISVFSIVIFPKLSQMIRKKEDKASINQLFSQSLFLLYCFSLPVCLGLIGLFWYLREIHFSLFEISTSAFADICLLAILGFIALPIRGFSSLHLAILSAHKDTRTPLFINTWAVILSLPLCYFFTRTSGILGLGIALIAVYLFIYFYEIYILYKKYSILAFSEIFSKRSCKILLVSLVWTAVFYQLYTFISPSPLIALLMSGLFVILCFASIALADDNVRILAKKMIKRY